MWEIILDALEKYSYTNDNGENVIPLSNYDDIIDYICEKMDDI